MTAVYEALANDAELTSELEASPLGGPGIYERWVHPNALKPYIGTEWRFTPSSFWAKGQAVVTFHIWEDANDTVHAERIRNLIINRLDRERLEADESGTGLNVRLFYNQNDAPLPDPDDPDIVHWPVEFDVHYWRQAFIRARLE